VVLHDSGIGQSYPYLAIVDGHPAAAFLVDAYQLFYVRSSTNTGSSPADWNNVVAIPAAQAGINPPSLVVAGGNPAVFFMGDPEGAETLAWNYIRSATATGGSAAAWGEAIQISTGDDLHYISRTVAIVNGNPAIAFRKGWEGFEIAYIRATSSTAQSEADWSQKVVFPTGFQELYIDLITVDGCPAIGYASPEPNGVRFMQAATPGGGSPTDWGPADIIDGSAYRSSMTVVNGNPACAYVKQEGETQSLIYAYYDR
jgi:hypothetical protein